MRRLHITKVIGSNFVATAIDLYFSAEGGAKINDFLAVSVLGCAPLIFLSPSCVFPPVRTV